MLGHRFDDCLDEEMKIYEEVFMPRKRQPQLRRHLVQTLLSEDVWRKAQKAAKVQGHSMSSWLRHIVTLAVNPSSTSP